MAGGQAANDNFEIYCSLCSRLLTEDDDVHFTVGPFGYDIDVICGPCFGRGQAGGSGEASGGLGSFGAGLGAGLFGGVGGGLAGLGGMGAGLGDFGAGLDLGDDVFGGLGGQSPDQDEAAPGAGKEEPAAD